MIPTPDRDASHGPFPYAEVHGVNEQCMDLLVSAARSRNDSPFGLPSFTLEALRRSTPEIRRRAAQHSILLVDLKFQDPDWWKMVRSPVDRVARPSSTRSGFPRKSSRSLARSAAMLAWHSVRSDLVTASVVLGLAKTVAQLLRETSLSEMDRIIERGHGVVAPRWLDRPAFWNALLQASESPSTASTRNVDLHGLQLLAGDST